MNLADPCFFWYRNFPGVKRKLKSQPFVSPTGKSDIREFLYITIQYHYMVKIHLQPAGT